MENILCNCEDICSCSFSEAAQGDASISVNSEDWTYYLTRDQYYEYERKNFSVLKEQDTIRKEFIEKASDKITNDLLLIEVKKLIGEKVLQDDRVQELELDKMSNRILQLLYTLLSRIRDEKLIVVSPKIRFEVDEEIEKMRKQLMEMEEE